MTTPQKTIAVIDDDPGVRSALARLLSAIGYPTETFGSAGEFLRAAPISDVACIVVDVGLGNTSGLELVRELSVSGLGFPVIFITSAEDEAIQRQAAELGCIAFLRKPFAADRLVEAVKKATSSTIQ